MTSPEAALFRELTRSVFDAQNALLRHGDIVNAPFGQTSARWRVLLQIAQGNNAVPGIARVTGYSRQATQRLTDALVTDQLAAYAPDQADRRRQVIHLSDKGQAVFAAMEDNFDSWSQRLIAQLAAADLAKATEILHTITRVVAQDCEQIQRSRRTNNER